LRVAGFRVSTVLIAAVYGVSKGGFCSKLSYTIVTAVRTRNGGESINELLLLTRMSAPGRASFLRLLQHPDQKDNFKKIE
jgi:hypothetical protein